MGLKSLSAILIVAPLLIVNFFAKMVNWTASVEPEFRLRLDQANDELIAVSLPPEFTWRFELAQPPDVEKVADWTFRMPLMASPNAGLLDSDAATTAPAPMFNVAPACT